MKIGELLGYRMAGPTELVDLLNGEMRQETLRREEAARRQRIRNTAYAQVTHMLGIGVGDMTEAQHQFASAVEDRMLGKSTKHRGYGFSMPGVHDRRPNYR